MQHVTTAVIAAYHATVKFMVLPWDFPSSWIFSKDISRKNIIEQGVKIWTIFKILNNTLSNIRDRYDLGYHCSGYCLYGGKKTRCDHLAPCVLGVRKMASKAKFIFTVSILTQSVFPKVIASPMTLKILVSNDDGQNVQERLRIKKNCWNMYIQYGITSDM